MMNAAEYAAWLIQSMDRSEQGWKIWREDLKVWQQLRSEQRDEPRFAKADLPKDMNKALSDGFKRLIIQPLKDALPPSVRSKISDIPIILLPIVATNGHALKAPNGEPVIVIDLGLLPVIELYASISPSYITLEQNVGKEFADAYMLRTYRFLIERFMNPSLPFPPELIKMPNNMLQLYMVQVMAMETFVIAHELAHIYANHLDHAEAKLLNIHSDGSVKAEFYQLSQQREFEADLLAWQWYQKVWKSLPYIGKLDELRGRLFPLSFFTMLDLIEKNVQIPDAYSTHPPAEARLMNLIVALSHENVDKEVVEGALGELGIARSNPVLLRFRVMKQKSSIFKEDQDIDDELIKHTADKLEWLLHTNPFKKME